MSQKIKIAFLTILTLIITNCGVVFANTELTVSNLKDILNYYNEDSYNTELYTDERLENAVNALNNSTYGYIRYKKGSRLDIGYNFTSQPRIRGITGGEYIEGSHRSYMMFSESNNEFTSGSVTYGNLDISGYYLYIVGNFINATNPSNNINYVDGYTNISGVINFYKSPYFEFSANKIGTTTIDGISGNINTYYVNSFETWSNSYGTFREIGRLYIDKNYIWDDIYFPSMSVSKSNISNTNTWNYTEYSFFKHEEINGYIPYSINLPYEIITSPYFYNIKLMSVDTSLGGNININFVTINKENTGGIIIDNSGDVISGDVIKDETTLGDIQNTIQNIFQNPNEEEIQKQQEENINAIKDNLTNSLNDNQIMGALTTAEQGFIEILQGEPRRF